MTGPEFEALLKKLYGDAGYRTKGREALQISEDTMDRYRANGPIPVAVVAILALEREFDRQEGDKVRAARYARIAKTRKAW